jgi:hypothetical protein
VRTGSRVEAGCRRLLTSSGIEGSRRRLRTCSRIEAGCRRLLGDLPLGRFGFQ